MNEPHHVAAHHRFSPRVERALHHLGAGVAWVALHPLRVPPVVTPGMFGLPYRTVPLRSGDATLAGWHVPCDGARAGVVLCHGHNDCRLQMLPMVRPLHEAGLHVLLFDFRSMGVSGGSRCTYGLDERRDVLAAVDWLHAEAGVDRTGLMGISMGAATALLAAASDTRVRAVVSDCAFARLEDMAEQNYYYLPPRLRASVGRSVRHWAEQWCGTALETVDPEAALRDWEPRPLLVIHGDRDRHIPLEHGRRLAAAAGETAELWVVPGAPHARSRPTAGRPYVERVTGFFRRHLGLHG